MAAVLPQPNFDHMSADLMRLSENFALFPNMPAYGMGQAILTVLLDIRGEIQGINTRLDGIEARLTSVEARLTSVEARLTSVEARLTSVEARLTSVETGQDELNDRLDQLKDRVVSSESNNLARICNLQVNNPVQKLTPLRSVSNTTINHFPMTLAELNGLNTQKVEAILGALGVEPVDATLNEKRKQLRILTGAVNDFIG
ncbi:hypothetical protein F4678DRAFT_461068 [Xylaria arbuscula]|nr:hypothetical protein F4678DRAFT_461068 [Xylaria arbuscula]